MKIRILLHQLYHRVCSWPLITLYVSRIGKHIIIHIDEELYLSRNFTLLTVQASRPEKHQTWPRSCQYSCHERCPIRLRWAWEATRLQFELRAGAIRPENHSWNGFRIDRCGRSTDGDGQNGHAPRAFGISRRQRRDPKASYCEKAAHSVGGKQVIMIL
jgi:hypothetical protein